MDDSGAEIRVYDDPDRDIEAHAYEADEIAPNEFKALAPEARLALRRCMYFPDKNSKTVSTIAQDILDRAGEVKKRDIPADAGRPIIITDSDVQLLVVAAGEAIGEYRKQEN